MAGGKECRRSPDWCGEVSTYLSCTGCGNKAGTKTTRCISCRNRDRAKPRPNCTDCGIEIKLKSVRCLPCHNKRQNKGKSRLRTLFNVSEAWRIVRTACFERDNYTCRACEHRGSRELHAHHCKQWSRYPELRLDLDNLLTLCAPCHREHHAMTKMWERICGGSSGDEN